MLMEKHRFAQGNELILKVCGKYIIYVLKETENA